MNERAPGLQFSIFRIPVRIEVWFFLIPLLALQNRGPKGAIIWTALVLGGVMVHELGHALAMRAYGFAPTITLHMLGGVTQFPADAKPTAHQSFFITLAGPGAGLALGAAAFAADQLIPAPSADLAQALSDAMWINVGWSIVNLAPILPWDGGIILDSALLWATGRRQHRIVALSSLIGGGLVVGGAFYVKSWLLGYFGAMGLFQGYGRWRAAGAAEPEHSSPPVGDGDGEEEKRLELELSHIADEAERARLNERLAWVRLRKGDFAGARRAADSMGAISPSTALQARLAASENDVDRVLQLLSPPGAASADELPLLLSALIAKERFQDAAELGRAHVALTTLAATRLFRAGAYGQALELCRAERLRTNDGVHAYNEACCLCRLGRLEEAVAALVEAKALGYSGLEGLQTDEDLAPVRQRPEVQALLSPP